MISIKYADIPHYLHKSAFYEALDREEDDAEIQIPEGCYAENGAIADSEQDFIRLVRVTDFWGLRKIPLGLLEYCSVTKPDVWDDIFEDLFPDLLGFPYALRFVFGRKFNRLSRAIELQRLEIIEFLIEKNDPGNEASAAAAEVGRLDYLKLLQQHGYSWGARASRKAAEGGHLECLKYLHTEGCAWDWSLYCSAAQNGHMECILYALEHGLENSWCVTETFASTGNLEYLQFAVQQGCELHVFATEAATKYGHVDCLRFLIEADCPVYANICSVAVANGDLECLQLLHEYGAEWDVTTTHTAAEAGHLHCVQYLHEHGCEWDEITAQMAAQSAQLDILRYLFANGCPYNNDIVRYATLTVAEDCCACLKYLSEEVHIPLSEDGPELYVALKRGNFIAFYYLLSKYSIADIIYTDEDSAMWCGELQEHYESEKYEGYDENLLQCIKSAVARHWNIANFAPGLIQFIGGYYTELPLCYEYLQTVGYICSA